MRALDLSLPKICFVALGTIFAMSVGPDIAHTLQQSVPKTKASKLIPALIGWYDRHKRQLPWRESREPYRVWLSEIMLQQTTVPAVIPYFQKFTTKYPTIKHLADAPQDQVMADWAGLGYYSRARNLHAAAKAVAALGTFPNTVETLKQLPGVGDYTAGAIAAIAFDQQATVVDGNVERVMARVEAITEPLPLSKPSLKAAAALYYIDRANTRPGDLPQAFMDLGSTICTPDKPKCMICPINDLCEARKLGIQDSLPARLPKAVRPKRKGYAYWITNNKGEILLHRRPEKGLLGGMAGLPTSDWNDKPAHLDFVSVSDDIGHIKHVFTHFELR
ncbi:MAG TPA: A/G-specific adenine glycosylase, partial [Alphaproteobacteria bacterium]